MSPHRAGTMSPSLQLVCLTMLGIIAGVHGLHFQDANSRTSYARYPKWNACLDASLSFEFRTNQPEGMLLYTDSKGSFDFLQVMTKSGRVNVIMNIVDEDVRLELDAGRDVTDGRWHMVNIQRKRMTTTLTVDGFTDSSTTHGSDFDFGDLETNNDVFLGGLPDAYSDIDALHELSLASALFEPRFIGSMRNIIYGNCSCGTVRAEFVEGVGMTLSPPEACTERNPCRNGCTCLSKDQGPACDCSRLDCLIFERSGDTHYFLPMDSITGSNVENPSGLDATAYGSPMLVPGVKGNAVRLHAPDQYIRVSGPSHRHECFGDLDKCPHGYTIAFWVKFDHPVDGDEIFLSNGGHTDRSYGVAMLYNAGKIEFRFRRKNAESWHVEHTDIFPNRWYHVAATWGQHEGLSLYIDGVLVDTDTQPQIRGSVTSDQRRFNSFILGRSNENQRRTRRATSHSSMSMDEFSFSSSHMNSYQAREMGPIFRYYFPMEVLDGNRLPDGRTPATIHGSPSLIKGKVGRALRLDGRLEYVDAGDVRATCLGDLQQCAHGLSVAFWINSFHVQDNMYYLDSGGTGIKVYYKQGKLIGEFQQGNRHWQVEWPNFKRNIWYFIELSWNPNDGARMYANLVQVSHDATYTHKLPHRGSTHFYIGRANTAMVDEKYAQAYIDEVEVLYADRSKCLSLGLIQRDTIQHIHIPFEIQHDNTIRHPLYQIFVYNGAKLVPAKVGNGVYMNASSQHQQWTSLGEHRDDCFGNLALCTHGLTIKMQILPMDLRDNQYYLSSGPYSLYYKNGRLYAKFCNGTKTWTVSTSFFRKQQWQDIELTWHEQRGLQMYIDGRQMGSTTVASDTPQKEITDWNVYLGRPNTMITTDKKVGRANAVIDEMELWFAHRDFIGMWPKLTLPPTNPPTTTTTTVAPENYMLFDGTNWILYNMAGLPAEQREKSDAEEIMIEFRTTEPNGLIWWAGMEDRNMHLSLKNGQILLVCDYGGGKVDRFRVAKPQGRLSDGEWHKVIVTRNGKNVVVDIDGLEADRALTHEPSIVTDGAILIGGYQNTRSITGKKVNHNLDGYVKQMRVETDHISQLDLFELFEGSPRPYWVIPNGILPENARSRPQPVTFQRRGAYLRLPKHEAAQEGVIAFKFRTTEPNGLLLYNGGPQSVQDFFSVEFYDGVMYYIIDIGKGVYRFPFSESVVNDGKPHHAKVERSGNDVVLHMDGKQLQYRVPGQANEPLDLDSSLYVGAVDVAGRLPWHLWTRESKYYLGCLWDLEINNGRPADLEAYIAEQKVSGIDTGCDEKVAMCLHNPCAHGRCVDTWAGAVCNCAGTVYNGERCEHFADVVTFDGTDFLRINIKPMLQTHTDDISLRFKTGKDNGLLFATDNEINHEYIKAYIENGHGKLRTNLGGRDHVAVFGRDLADDEWHTLYIKRRANELDVWVDDNDKVSTQLPGSGWTLDIDTLMVAARGERHPEGAFAGWMQNFYLGKWAIMDIIKTPPPGWITEGDPSVGATGKPIPEHAVTLTHPMDSYATLSTLEAVEDMEVSFMFKTKDADGLLLYNGGNNNQFIAVELIGGYVYLVINDGGETRIYKATSERLSDDRWHFVKVKRVGYAFTVVVDQASAFFSGRTKRQGSRVDLAGALYVGGMPRDLYNRLPFEVQSRRGFRGCLASIKIGGRMYNLLKDSVFVSSYIKQNCTSTGMFCFANPCKNNGICLDGVSTYICDCNMTAYVGRICTDEPEGYRYGLSYRPGFYSYNYDDAWSSKKDSVALGFMTWFENGTIARFESDHSSDYIEIKMLNGHVVVEYNVGGGVHRLVEDYKKFNDGAYHVVVFERSAENATLRVDSYPTNRFISSGNTGVKLFNEVMRINVGGLQVYMDDRRKAKNAFNGIIAGLYFNGLRVLDSGIIHQSIHGETHGDVNVAKHRFYLPQARPPTALPPGPTDKPDTGVNPPRPVPPVYTPVEVPLENSGGGSVWGTTHGGEGGASVVQPGGGGAGAINVGNGPLSQPVVAPFLAGGPAEGGRAAAFAGTFIGALLLASSLVYALYKLKPGTLACLGGKAGGGGASKGGPVISSPTARATTNYHLLGSGAATAVKADVANGAAATGTGVSMSSFGTQTLEHGASAGGAGGAGGATAQTQAFADYFSSIQQTSTTSVGQASGGGGGYGTMTRAIQTDYQQTDAAPAAAAAGQGLVNNYDQQTLNQQHQQQFSSFQQESNSYSALDSYQTSSSYMQQQNTLQNDQSGAWQMHTMALGSGAQNLATLAAEEIRVDCLLMTSDGQHVVTGSIYGPPQAWDLGSGELVRIMSGEELSSTDLHLACKDTLLVGQVAEMAQVDPADPQANSRIHNRKLQIWDFLTGRPLEMEKNELCTASCMMADGERIVLGRTEKFGGGTTIVIYDLLANEPVRTLRYEAAVGFADYISYLNLSKDNRYVIAGFQNSYDGNANFIIFDLTADSYNNAVEPKLLALDACAECTAVLDNHEAVTGTRNGELLIWSMRTGKPLRQLVSATGGTTMTRMGVSKSVAHAKEVKAVSVSLDGKLLVSASSDCTLKVWNLESERQLTTLKGHTDEIWCCTISNDNDIVVSGSRDGTIRLWRLATASPICVYNTGVDVFSVRMSNNKRTIVALGDKFGARKLIMLRVVITKTRSRAPSRATSPIHMGSRPTSPYRATSPLIR